MDHVALVVPILPGKVDQMRAFYREVEGARRGAYEESERRLEITKEVAFLAQTEAGELAVIYIEAADFENAFGQFVASQGEFDLWFKDQVREISGLDLNDPPEMALPEMLSVYSRKDE